MFPLLAVRKLSLNFHYYDPCHRFSQLHCDYPSPWSEGEKRWRHWESLPVSAPRPEDASCEVRANHSRAGPHTSALKMGLVHRRRTAALTNRRRGPHVPYPTCSFPSGPSRFPLKRRNTSWSTLMFWVIGMPRRYLIDGHSHLELSRVILRMETLQKAEYLSLRQLKT